MYIMPAEWEKHERTFVEWCVHDSLVFPDNYEEVCNGYAETINAILQFEPVTVIVNQEDVEKVLKLCPKASILIIEHNDAWCRDNGPTFVYDKKGALHGINWQFNAWGERFKPYDLDNKVAQKVLSHFNFPCIDSDIVLEGGSIHSNGRGIILTTRECLLNKNRNPHLSQERIEAELKSKLGARQIIWLNKGLFGDETDGHVDNAACFSDENTVIIQMCYDKSDENYDITHENLEILRAVIDENGEKLNIIEIEQPPKRFHGDIRLTLSYINFYIANGGIVLPVFGEDAIDTDKKAEKVIKSAFPNRRIITVDGMKLIKEGGNVHCITQQMPLRQRIKKR
ncbi:MAG: agmatine deiminase family protein [Clostridiales bacterium]|nr:agmatine deiminase family protein [Clostridiales bacterium]